MLNYFELNTAPLNTIPSAGGDTSLPKANLKVYNLTNTSATAQIAAAIVDMFEVIKQTAQDAGYTVVESVQVLGDATTAKVLDIRTNNAVEANPRYYIAIPDDVNNTRAPTMGSYRGGSLDTSPTYTFCNYDELDRSIWADQSVYETGNVTLRVYANKTTKVVWFAISVGAYVFTFYCGLPLPRRADDTQTLINSYPRYGVYTTNYIGFHVSYANGSITDGVSDLTNKEMGIFLPCNSLISQSHLSNYETVGGIANGTRNFTYDIYPLVSYSDFLFSDGWQQLTINQPAHFDTVPSLRGVYISDDIENFSTFTYGSKTYAIIKNDYMRYYYLAGAVATTIGIEILPTGLMALADWNAP